MDTHTAPAEITDRSVFRCDTHPALPRKQTFHLPGMIEKNMRGLKLGVVGMFFSTTQLLPLAGVVTLIATDGVFILVTITPVRVLLPRGSSNSWVRRSRSKSSGTRVFR